MQTDKKAPAPPAASESQQQQPQPPDSGANSAERVYLLSSTDGETPLLDVIRSYQAGDKTWEDVLEVAEAFEPRPRKNLGDGTAGWHSVEDDFPEAGTLDEIAAAAAGLDDDEVDELYALFEEDEE